MGDILQREMGTGGDSHYRKEQRASWNMHMLQSYLKARFGSLANASLNRAASKAPGKQVMSSPFPPSVCLHSTAHFPSPPCFHPPQLPAALLHLSLFQTKQICERLREAGRHVLGGWGLETRRPLQQPSLWLEGPCCPRAMAVLHITHPQRFRRCRLNLHQLSSWVNIKERIGSTAFLKNISIKSGFFHPHAHQSRKSEGHWQPGAGCDSRDISPRGDRGFAGISTKSCSGTG